MNILNYSLLSVHEFYSMYQPNLIKVKQLGIFLWPIWLPLLLVDPLFYITCLHGFFFLLYICIYIYMYVLSQLHHIHPFVEAGVSL